MRWFWCPPWEPFCWSSFETEEGSEHHLRSKWGFRPGNLQQGPRVAMQSSAGVSPLGDWWCSYGVNHSLIDTWHAAAPQCGNGEFCFGRKNYRCLSCIYVPIKALKVQGHHDISLYNSSLEVYALYPDLIPFLWHKSQYLLFILYVYP